MEDAFDEVLKIIRTESRDGDKIVMKLFLEDNPNHRPIFIGIRPLSALNVDIIFAHLGKVQQSTTVFHSTDVLGVRAYLLHTMTGRGYSRNPSRMNPDEVRRFKNKSMIDVKPEKNCLPIALIFGMVLWGDNNVPVKLNKAAKELIMKISPSKFREDDIIFVITNLPGFFGLKYQCLDCDTLYCNGHVCPEKCKYCGQNPPCPNVASMVKCSSCHRRFRGQGCIDNHNISGICKKLKMCPQCFLTYDATKDHDCDKRKCLICFQNCTIPHYCHMQQYRNKTKANNTA
uniref:Uncharacterized protein n=1 Tax=Lutzomyia longipalpis TaxID=7200 RepID=A0A1B0GJ31_LUTLO